MTESATQQIYDHVSALWETISSPGSALPASFGQYAQTRPLTDARLKSIIPYATPSMMSAFKLRQAQPPLSDTKIMFHALRDPVAKILTIFNARIDSYHKGEIPVDYMDSTLAKTCFYIEKIPLTFRQMFNIKAMDETLFADFLKEIETKILPHIRELLPVSLEETGHSVEDFDRHYEKLQSEFPSRTLGIDTIGPRNIHVVTTNKSLALQP